MEFIYLIFCYKYFLGCFNMWFYVINNKNGIVNLLLKLIVFYFFKLV